MKSIGVDPITAFKWAVVGVFGASAADAVGPWLLVVFVGLFSAWLSSAFAATAGKVASARMLARHAFTALVVTLPTLHLAGAYFHDRPGVVEALPWLLVPIAAACGYIGPDWFVNWFKSMRKGGEGSA